MKTLIALTLFCFFFTVCIDAQTASPERDFTAIDFTATPIGMGKDFTAIDFTATPLGMGKEFIDIDFKAALIGAGRQFDGVDFKAFPTSSKTEEQKAEGLQKE